MSFNIPGRKKTWENMANKRMCTWASTKEHPLPSNDRKALSLETHAWSEIRGWVENIRKIEDLWNC